ncbi:MAG TPA: restriction endonuclease subunit S [Kiritimatiellia bacterium]|nr:restriction endonuclease subunit S [Kiritimatiellia bacterium]
MATEAFIDCTVGELAVKTRNALVGGPFGSDLVSKDYVPAGVPVIRGTNMGHGRWVDGEFAYVTPEKAESLSSNCAKPGDIVFTQRGTLGQVAIVPKKGVDRYLISQSQMKLTVDAEKADTVFLYYVFTSAEQQDYIRQNAIQTGVPHTNLGILRNTPLTLPPLPIQKRIAHILGTLDDNIELNRRMNETLEGMARALFQSWFIDFDPVRRNMDRNQPSTRPAGHPSPSGRRGGEEGRFALDPAIAALFPEHLEDSPLGYIPKGWTVGTVGDIGTNSRRGVQPGDIAPNTPYIALEHMPRRCIALGDWDDSADVASGKSAFNKGEILFGKLRPYFHKVGVAPFDGVCSTDILVLAPKSPEWFGFLLGHASSDELIQFTDLASTGTKMPRTNWSDISSFKVAVPSKPIAAAFTRIIQPMLDRIHANLHQSRTLATLRDTLLPKLLSGELSVAEVEKEVPA